MAKLKENFDYLVDETTLETLSCPVWVNVYGDNEVQWLGAYWYDYRDAVAHYEDRDDCIGRWKITPKETANA